MKADMSALKEQMASMMEAMLGMRQLMEKNVATAIAVSSAAEADPTLLATAHHPPPNMVRRGRSTLGHNSNPHLGYNRVAYLYGLPPNYTPPVMQDDVGHVSSPILEGEPPQQPDEPKAPIQREAPQVLAPTTTRPAGNSNAMRNFPPKPIPEFTPPNDIRRPLAVPYRQPNGRPTFDRCWMADISRGRCDPLANHGGGAVNAIESDRPRRSKPLKDVATPRRFIFEALQKGGVIPHGGHKEDSCLLHFGKLHNMETRLAVEELLQRMIDQGRLEVDDEGREEQHICIQSADERSFGRPKPLVIYFTKDAAPQNPQYPSATKPVPFPYQNSHAVSWRYTPPSEREEEATDVSSLSTKVTNITGLNGVTRSGRVFAPSDLPTQPANSKGKAKMVEEQNDKTTLTPNEDIPVKGLPEKRDGYDKKEVSLEEASEFLRIIQQSEFKVIEQLNKTPARVSLLELLMSSEPHWAFLVKDNGSITSLISSKGNCGKFGLGYKPTRADIKKDITGRKSGDQGSPLGQEVKRDPPCHISRSFISVGLGHEGQVIAICEDDSPSGSELVRPCPPGFRLGNWRVEECPDIYATSII
ncbi:hypothetical protein HKD37_01G001051 [Glycine soja]